MGMAKYEMKFMIELQLPIPPVHSDMFLLPYFAIWLSLMSTSSKLVKKEKRGAKGNAVAKNAIKPS